MKLFFSLLIIFLVKLVCVNASAKNIKTVNDIFDGFSKGDLKPFTDSLADKYEFKTMAAAETDPIFGDFSNRAMDFFTKSPYAITSSKVVNIVSNKDTVAAYLESTVEVASSGKKGTTTGVNTFTFDNKGKVIKFILTEDTALIQDLLTDGVTPYSLVHFITSLNSDWKSKNMDSAFARYAEDCKFSENNDSFSLDKFKERVNNLHASMPDFMMNMIGYAANENTIIGRYKYQGTFTGKPFMGVPANNKKIWGYATIAQTIKDNKIISNHMDIDHLSMLIQMGIIKM